MNQYDSASLYRQSTAFGATPVGQVLALYDAILRDLHRAMDALDHGQVEKRVDAVNHALLVIGELQGVLDFERGGEPARNLERFYRVARSLILQGSIKNSRATFQEVFSMVTRVRAAWAQIERTTSVLEPPDRPPNTAPQPQIAPDEPAALDEVGATGSGWRA